MLRNVVSTLLLIVCVSVLAACDSGSNDSPQPVPREFADSLYTVTASGLKYYDFVEGDGVVSAEGDTAWVHYTGWLTNDAIFDSSILNGRQPFGLLVGRPGVIDGWIEGIPGMQKGTQRQLVIPPELAYGSQGRPSIPPNSTLIFEVAMVELRPAQ